MEWFEKWPERASATNQVKRGLPDDQKLECYVHKFRSVHGDRYDYSLVTYTNRATKIKIICSRHGEFEQTPTNHLSGRGCPYCSGTKRLTTEQFIAQAIEVHGHRYDYSLVKYIRAHDKVKIICPEHGEFEQEPNAHCIKEHGCPGCTGKKPSDTVYLLKLVEYENVYKIGVTGRLQDRCTDISRSLGSPVISLKYIKHPNPRELEKSLLARYTKYATRSEIPDLPTSFDGSTECRILTEAEVKEIIAEMEQYDGSI